MATKQPHAERLVVCDKFLLDRWRLPGPARLVAENRFHILSCIEGELTVAWKNGTCALRRGDTVLVPACCEQLSLEPRGGVVMLDMYLS
jgi:mannose-6-phosphate isomerase